MIKENMVYAKQRKEMTSSLSIAKILMTLAVYFFSAATLLEYFSTINVLKGIGFMLSAHAFYFLWKNKQQNSI